MNFDILDKLKNGDHRAFERVYEEWHTRVFHYFLKNQGDEYVAKDLAQQTFIKLWRYRAEVSVELSIDQQLFQKARLVFVDWLRKEATYRKHFTAEDIQQLPHYVDADEISELKCALNFLPEKRKRVFELKHIHGYSYKEIAEYLNISVKTVDNHLLKATAQLRKAFNIFSSVGIVLMTTL